MKNTKDIVIVGASSEVAIEFAKILNKEKYNVHKISSHQTSKPNVFVKDYLQDLNLITSYLNNLTNPIIFFFNGYLRENRPEYFPNIDELINTYKINFQVPQMIIDKLVKADKVCKFIVISSIAGIKPRYKNYYYGYTKKLLEDYVVNIQKQQYLILRFGKIETKMSKNHKNPPFKLSKFDCCKLILKNINKHGIVHPTIGLKFTNIFISALPIKIINLIESKLLK